MGATSFVYVGTGAFAGAFAGAWPSALIIAAHNTTPDATIASVFMSAFLSAFITARGAPPPRALARRLRASLGPQALYLPLQPATR